MGLLNGADWSAQWIGAPFVGGPRTTSPAPHLRKEFALAKPVVTARLYATALGLYESYLNGARVGDDVLTPGWTDYTKHVQYQVYDVTAMLQPGANALGAILGDGWAVGHVAWSGRQRYVDRPRLLAQLILTYLDGSIETIATDDTWKVGVGPILESDMPMGESYDARRELPGWGAPGYDDTHWWPAEVFADTGAARVATNGPRVLRHEELQPVEVREIPDFVNPRWVFDLGQNMVGWVQLRVSGLAGATVTLRYAEALNPDGTLYTASLRNARNTDHYTLRGDGEEAWEPRFTFHGFRYVELSGFPGRPTLGTITGIVIHSDTPMTGTFACSDPLTNQLQHNIIWSQKGNFVDIPTDCPQRDERLGWTGDAQVFIRTAAFNMDVAGFFTKWTRDLEDAQSAEGAYPAVAPNPSVWPRNDGGPAWADAGVICPWTIYLCYGDTRLLEARYESMRRFIRFLDETNHDGLRCYAEYTGWRGFGDWLALDGSDGREGATSKELIGTAFFAYSARLLAQIAQVLGKHEDAARYHVLTDEVRDAFRKRFVAPDGKIVGGTQTSYVLALHFDLLPAELRSVAAAELARDIERRGNHLSTGFVGTPYINWALSEAGFLDTAYALLKQTSWPSWLYSVTQGATTIWERWDGWTHDRGFQDPGMNSFNHYAYGAIGAWLYAVIGGIDLDPERPGYKHIVMRPRPGGDLTNALVELRSVYGLIRSAWTLENGTFDWRIMIPANTTATVYVPVTDGAKVREGDIPAADAPGVRFLRREAAAEVYEVASGEYHFTAS
jgi:alpha-L-rhamnosidase